MNILFLLRGTDVGGLEIVTKVIAEKFVKEGHWVGFFIFRKDAGPSITENLNSKIALYQNYDYRLTKDNTNSLRHVLIDNNVQVIINQWGLPLVPIKTARKATEGLNVKIISVYHQSPDANGRIQSVEDEIKNCSLSIKLPLLKFKKNIYREITCRAMRFNYDHSDKFLVLSDSYIDVFKNFTHIKHPAKLGVMANPVTLASDGFIYSYASKQKEIIYVGRLDFVQKRVYRIINSWKLLERKYPDWKLTIVGDGPQRSELESLVKRNQLLNVKFEGFQPPLDYYKRASVLVLTSDFEGFPLVLAEAMSFGVVPVVYDSFASIRDIIIDGVNGVIVPKINDSFMESEMANKIEMLLSDTTKIQTMAMCAIEKSHDYSLDTVYQRWMMLLNNL